MQSAYLDWFHRRLLASLPPERRRSIVHAAQAIDVRDDVDGRQRVRLTTARAARTPTSSCSRSATSTPSPTRTSAAFADGRRRARPRPRPRRATPPSSTCRCCEPAPTSSRSASARRSPTSSCSLTEGRGGRFVDDGDGTLRYEPSGDEPVLHVGSRRGVPYRSKIDYRLQAPPRTVAALPRRRRDRRRCSLATARSTSGATCCRSCVKEVGWAYYHELFHAHPERTRDRAGMSSPAATGHADAGRSTDCRCVPRPTTSSTSTGSTGRSPGCSSPVGARAARHTCATTSPPTSPDAPIPTYSADLGVFYALLRTFGVIGRLGVTGVVCRRDRGSRTSTAGGSASSCTTPAVRRRPGLRQLLALERRRPGALHRRRHHGATPTTPRRSSPRARAIPTRCVAGALIEAVVAAATSAAPPTSCCSSLRDRGEVDRGGRHRRRRWQAEHRQGRRVAARRCTWSTPTAGSTRAATAPARSPVVRPPARSPARAPTPRRSASTTRSPASSSPSSPPSR